MGQDILLTGAFWLANLKNNNSSYLERAQLAEARQLLGVPSFNSKKITPPLSRKMLSCYPKEHKILRIAVGQQKPKTNKLNVFEATAAHPSNLSANGLLEH